MYLLLICILPLNSHRQEYGKDEKQARAIVVRVLPGGDEYYVYILEDNNTKRKIKQISGPYVCRPTSHPEVAK